LAFIFPIVLAGFVDFFDWRRFRPTNKCNHPEGGLISNGEGEFSVIDFTYCPKCGEEL
jgi:hypothetical protein